MNIMKIKFDDGTECRLPDISIERFSEFMFNGGTDDIEYEKYKHKNGMAELTDFNSQSTGEITLVIEQPYIGRVLEFKCVYDSDNDENFDEEEYFKQRG